MDMAPESTAIAAESAGNGRSAGAGKKPRPSRPDFDQHKKELGAVDAAIDRLRKEQDEIRDKLNKGDSRKGPQADTRTKMLGRLQEIRAEQANLRKSRGKVFDRQASLTSSISRKAAELKAQQAKLTYKTVDEIDETIAKSEQQIESGSLKIVEERRLASEISSLRRVRKLVEQAAKLQASIDAEAAELAEVDAQLADTNAQALGEEYERLQGELDALKASQGQGQHQRGELFNERARILKALDQEWEKKRALQDEHRRQNNEYYQWQQEDRKRRAIEEKQQRVQEQREKRLAIAQEQREEAEVPAYANEISGCDSLIRYLNELLPSSAAASGSNKADNGSMRPSSSVSGARDVDASTHIPAGMVAVKKTTVEESYFVGTGSSKSKKKPARKNNRVDVLKHPLAVVERFLELQVDIPTTTTSVAGTIEKLNEWRQHYVANQAKATEENREKAEERIAKLMAELEVDEKIVAGA
ncbi:multicopy suppressor of BFA (Brefeldin A) [Coemansia sp. RSA 2322]|nr:multicopy suppressor of BFA (Brefeldin A) [Coemansia sp. RSA 2322]